MSEALCPGEGGTDWEGLYASSFISSYMLKMCILLEYMAASEAKDGSLEVNSDLDWARKIYGRMEKAFEVQRLESFFIPGYNLLHDDKYAQYRETAISYVRLCRRLLTPEAAAHFRKAYMGLQ